MVMAKLEESPVNSACKTPATGPKFDVAQPHDL